MKIVNKLIALKRKLTKIYNQFYPFSVLFLLLLIVIASIGQSVYLYFYSEDWNLMMKVANPNLYFAGMIPGIIGEGTYKYFQMWYAPIYSIFKLNSHPYFFVGVILYYISTVCIYFFSYELSGKKTFAFICAAIFASMAYIGSFTVIFLYSAYPVYLALILTSLSLYFFLRYAHLKKIRYYIFSVIFYFIAIEFINFRSHGIIYAIFGTSILFFNWKLNFKKIFVRVLEVFPFILLYLYKYGQHTGGNVFKYFLETVSPDGSFGYIINPFGTFSNIVIPDILTKNLFSYLSINFSLRAQELLVLGLFVCITILFAKANKKRRLIYPFLILLNIAFLILNQWVITYPLFWKVTAFSAFISFLGFNLFLICLLAVNNLWDKKNLYARIILFGLFWIFTQYSTYFILFIQDSLFPSDYKYIKIASVGVVFILAVIISDLKIKKINFSPYTTLIVVIIFAFLINSQIYTMRKDFSEPAEKFYKDMKIAVPAIKKDSTIILDVESGRDMRMKVGSAFPNIGLGLHYDIGNTVNTNYSLEEIIPDLISGKILVKDIIGVHVSPDKITNTTNLLRELLTERKIVTSIAGGWKTNLSIQRGPDILVETFLFPKKTGAYGVNPVLEAEVNHPSLAPSLLSITMSVGSKTLDKNAFPYLDVTRDITNINDENQFLNLPDDLMLSNVVCDNRLPYLRTQLERNIFISSAKISVGEGSQLKATTILTDKDEDSGWVAEQEAWDKNKKAEIFIDLGALKVIRRVIWTNLSKQRSPKTYEIYTSEDSRDWMTVKKIENSKPLVNNEIITEEINPISARYIKMVFLATTTQYSPAVSEIWIDSLDGNYAVNIGEAEKITASPYYCLVKTQDEERKLSNLVKQDANIRVWWTVDNNPDYSLSKLRKVDIFADGQPHTYSLYLPSEGTAFSRVKIEGFQFPVNVILHDVSFQTLNLKEIEGYKNSLLQ